MRSCPFPSSWPGSGPAGIARAWPQRRATDARPRLRPARPHFRCMGRSSRGHCIEQPREREPVDSELERLLAVHGDHRDALAVLTMEQRVRRDVDFDQVEISFASQGLYLGPRVFAQVTARLRVEDYFVARGQWLVARGHAATVALASSVR